MSESLNTKSRVTGDCHARFCERLEVRILRSTRQYFCGETYFQFEKPFDPQRVRTLPLAPGYRRSGEVIETQ